MARSSDDARTSAAIVAAFHARAQAFHPPSPTGGQLDAIRSGLGRAASNVGSVRGMHDDAHLYQRTVGSDRRSAEHADAVLLFADLTTDELRVLELREWAVLDGHDVYERVVASADLVERVIGEEARTTLAVKMTRGGDVFVRQAVSVERERDPVGLGEAPVLTETVVEDRAVVQGTRARKSSLESIAVAMGWCEGIERRAQWWTYRPPACRDDNAPYYGGAALVVYCGACGAVRELAGAGKLEKHGKTCVVDAGARRAAKVLRSAREKVGFTRAEMAGREAAEEGSTDAPPAKKRGGSGEGGGSGGAAPASATVRIDAAAAQAARIAALEAEVAESVRSVTTSRRAR